MKPIIGIIAPRFTGEDNPFNDYTRFVDNFPKRIVEAGGIPIGILFPDNKFNIDTLDLCDGFLFQGGPTIYSSQINTVHYALQKNKPILGICLGFQTMLGYEWVRDEFGDNIPTYEEIESFFKPEDEVNFIEKKQGHDNLNPFYLSKLEKSKHEILLDKNSILAKIFECTYLNMPSLHTWSGEDRILTENKPHIFKVVGRSSDGNMEAIESTNPNWWAVGVQFHPELEDKNMKLFKTLINKAK